LAIVARKADFVFNIDRVTEPGFHFMMPFLTSMDNVQTTLQTDVVRDIPCGTSGYPLSLTLMNCCPNVICCFLFSGSVIYFDKVEVVNLLEKQHAHDTIKKYGVNYDKTWIFDRIHHEISAPLPPPPPPPPPSPPSAPPPPPLPLPLPLPLVVSKDL